MTPHQRALRDAERTLLHVGHHLWRLYVANRVAPGLLAALESVWDCKRAVREQITESPRVRPNRPKNAQRRPRTGDLFG